MDDIDRGMTMEKAAPMSFKMEPLDPARKLSAGRRLGGTTSSKGIAWRDR
jgi:hypothetical protein